VLFAGIQSALQSTLRKHHPQADKITITIDPATGRIEAIKDGVGINPEELGRIAGETTKQSIIQKIREVHRESLVDDDERAETVVHVMPKPGVTDPEAESARA